MDPKPASVVAIGRYSVCSISKLDVTIVTDELQTDKKIMLECSKICNGKQRYPV